MTLLVLNRLSKSYGPTRALVEFSLTVDRGEVVALVGENGAGKSTIARLLAGAETADAGTISLEGTTLHLSSPREAMRRGIGFIPQELAPVPSLSLAENLFLGDWPATLGVVSPRRQLSAARSELAALGFADIDVARRAESASLPELQLIEIAKAVRRHSAVIVFDEPTASLSEAETRILHRIIAMLSQRQVGVIYISHRMDEVFAFSHTICVLRNGRKVAEHQVAAVSRETIVEEMVGRSLAIATSAPGLGTEAESPELLRLTGCGRDERPILTDVSLTLHRGEIVGLYGLRGSGADTLGAVLGGHVRASRGRLWVRTHEVNLPRYPRDAKRYGIRYIPADRKKEGLALRLSVADNVSLPNLHLVSRFGVLVAGQQREIVSRFVRLLRIRLNAVTQRAEELSGGNQQKVLLASRLAQPGDVLVLQEPTRGVDVGSRADIHNALRQLAADGTGILLFSSDVDEVVTTAHRVLIFRDGRVVTELRGAECTQPHAVSAATASHNGPVDGPGGGITTTTTRRSL